MTTKVEHNDDGAEIRRLLLAYHAAIVAADTDCLSDLLAADYFLVHITGYKQPREEWFDVIRASQFDYHKTDIEQDSLAVSVTGVTADVTGRVFSTPLSTACAKPWKLQFAMKWARGEQGWKVMSARYTSY